MTKEDVVALMSSSKTPREWNANCAKVKEAHNGHYPNYWYETFLATGLADKILKAAGHAEGASITVNEI
jgi:hypothetical protein